MRVIAIKLFRFLASYGLAVALLSLLFLLVFFGTLEQVNQGLYQVQKEYFESLFVVHYAGGIPIPLPGVYLLLGLLFVNLLLGGIVRAPKNWRRPGLLIAHSGILFLILAGFVTYHFSTNGHMTLYENESAGEYESYYTWEIAITETGPPQRTFVIPESRFAQLRGNRSRRFEAADLPFALELKGFLPNSMPRQAAPGVENGVDGIVLESREASREAEQNIAGIYAAVLTAAPQSRQEAALWGMARAPWVVSVNDRDYAIDLRRQRWSAPFAIRLDKFTRELHPGTGIASNFQSEVTTIENGSERKVTIRMNEPLRYKGHTFYQASWGPQNAGPNTSLFSSLAVVRNPADQWPLYASCIISLGLVIHFIQALLHYLRIENRRRAT